MLAFIKKIYTVQFIKFKCKINKTEFQINVHHPLPKKQVTELTTILCYEEEFYHTSN